MFKDLSLILVTLVTAVSLAGCGSAGAEPGDASSGAGCGTSGTSCATCSGAECATSCSSCSTSCSASCSGCSTSCSTSCSACSTCAGGCIDTSNDPRNCGFCGHDCQGAACTEGLCEPTLLATLPHGYSVVVDATYVYYTDTSADEIRKVPIAGGPPEVVAANQPTPVQVAIDGTHLYWTNSGRIGMPGSVQRIPLSGGSPSALETPVVYPLGLAVDATHVYYSQGYPSGDVRRVLKGGGAPQIVASDQAAVVSIVVGATHVYWGTGGAGGEGTVAKRPLAGGSLELLASGLIDVTALSLARENLYYASGGGFPNDLFKLSIDGEEPPDMIAGAPSTILCSAVDATHVYWGAFAGEVYRTPLAGGPSQQIGKIASQANAIAVDATSIYTIRSGGIEKLPK